MSSGGNQTIVGAAMPEVSTHRRATIAAAIVTMTTRRYCMNATRRTSAPNVSAISTMAVEAPGADPHTAVVPGRMRRRLIDQPRKLDAATVESTAISTSSQSAAIVAKMSTRIAVAIRLPMTACAASKAKRGARIVAPDVPSTIAAIMAPISRAAGTVNASSTNTSSTVATASSAHCNGMEKDAIGPGGGAAVDGI